MSPRLPQVTAKKLIRALKRAGFREVNQHGSHLTLWHEQKQCITTVPIHPGDIKRPLLQAIIRQAGLSDEEFRELL